MRGSILRPIVVSLSCAVASLSLMAVGSVSPAAASEVWYQSYGRADSTVACTETTEDELLAGWTQWWPSWEWWPGNGAGGFVCSRYNVWAQGSVPAEESGPTPDPRAGAGCLAYNSFDWVDFGGTWFVASGTAPIYSDPACTTVRGGGSTAVPFVYAPTPSTTGEEPVTLCQEAFGNTYTRVEQYGGSPDVYACAT